MNLRDDINQRNIKFFKEFLGLSKNDFFDKMRKIGRPKGFGKYKWSNENPTAGRCGSVVNAIRLSGKIPKDYQACWQKDNEGTHYYMINEENGKVIDPTCYQMVEDYNYENHKKSFLPQIGKNVIDVMHILELKIDENKFLVRKDSRGVKLVSEINRGV